MRELIGDTVVTDVLAHAPDVAWSISVRDCMSGAEILNYRGTAIQRIASIGKFLLLLETARQIETGFLSEHQLLHRSKEDSVRDSGLWQFLEVDALSVNDVCVLIGRVSDNLATNVLLRRVGLANVEVLSRGLGLRTTRLHDKVRDVRTPQDPRTLSTGSAEELSGIMYQLATDSLVNHNVSRRVARWMQGGADLSMVAASWGLDPLSHTDGVEGIHLIHKTGTDVGVRADVGIAQGPSGSVAYAALAEWDAPHVQAVDVLAGMRRLGDVLRATITEPDRVGH